MRGAQERFPPGGGAGSNVTAQQCVVTACWTFLKGMGSAWRKTLRASGLSSPEMASAAVPAAL